VLRVQALVQWVVKMWSCQWTPKSWVPDIKMEAVRDRTPPFHHEQEGWLIHSEGTGKGSLNKTVPSF